MVPERISRILTAYVDGELDARQRKVVARLLRRSSEARKLLQGLQSDADQLHSLPAQALPLDFSEQVLRTIANHKPEFARRAAEVARFRIPTWLGLATAAAAVLLVVGLRAYLTVTTLDRQEPRQLLARNGRPLPPEDEPSSDEVAAAAPTAAGRELLPGPSPAREPTPLPPAEIVRAEKRQPESAVKPPPILGSQISGKDARLRDPEERAVLVYRLSDLDLATGKQLESQLQKWSAHVLDLRCMNPVAEVERLKTALGARGIQFSIEPDALAALKLGIGKTTSFALYFEEITAEEIVAVLRQFHATNAERQRISPARPETLMVNAMARDEEQRLWHLFGVDPVRSAAGLASPSVGTEDAPRLESGKSKRRAIVVAYSPGRSRPVSAELKRFLDGRGARRSGTLQIVLVLSAAKS